MQPRDVLAIVDRNETADDSAPVAALRAVAFVAETRHQRGVVRVA